MNPEQPQLFSWSDDAPYYREILDRFVQKCFNKANTNPERLTAQRAGIAISQLPKPPMWRLTLGLGYTRVLGASHWVLQISPDDIRLSRLAWENLDDYAEQSQVLATWTPEHGFERQHCEVREWINDASTHDYELYTDDADEWPTNEEVIEALQAKYSANPSLEVPVPVPTDPPPVHPLPNLIPETRNPDPVPPLPLLPAGTLIASRETATIVMIHHAVILPEGAGYRCYEGGDKSTVMTSEVGEGQEWQVLELGDHPIEIIDSRHPL